MKKLLLLLVFVMIFSLVACSKDAPDENAINDYINATEYEDHGARATFTAVILETGSHSILVAPDEGTAVARSGDKASVSVPASVEITGADGESIHREDLKEGDHISITFDGTVMESYPLQISRIFKIKVLAD